MKSADITGTADGSTYTTTGMVIGGAGYIASPGFFMTSGGALTLKGNVSASSGNIGGWTLGSGTLKSADITGTADGSTYTTTGMVIGGAGYIASPGFFMTSGGALTLKGNVSASSGNIGGWTIGSGTLKSNDATGTTDGSTFTTTGMVIAGGTGAIATKNFFVDSAGDVSARNVTLEGVARGDVFTYSYKTLTTGEMANYYERFTYDSSHDEAYDDKNYIYFDLGGTLDGEAISDQAAQFYRLESGNGTDHNGNTVSTDNYPIAVVRAPNPNDENNFDIGSLIVFEAANHTTYFKKEISRNVYSSVSHHSGTDQIENNRFTADPDDTFGYFTAGPGGTYGASTCAGIASGGRVFIVKNKYGWRIVAMSSYDGMEHVVHKANISVATTTLNDDYEVYVDGDIGATGNVVAYVSDARLKKDLVKIDNPVEILQKLTGYQFTWNEKAVKDRIGKRDLGLIAQEVEEVLPEAVQDFLHPGDLTIDGTTETYKAVLYDRMVPVLVGGINQLDNELGTVRNVMDQQERQIALLKKRVETMETMKYLQSTWRWLENAKKFLKLK